MLESVISRITGLMDQKLMNSQSIVNLQLLIMEDKGIKSSHIMSVL